MPNSSQDPTHLASFCSCHGNCLRNLGLCLPFLQVMVMGKSCPPLCSCSSGTSPFSALFTSRYACSSVLHVWVWKGPGLAAHLALLPWAKAMARLCTWLVTSRPEQQVDWRIALRDTPLAPWCGATRGTKRTEGPHSARAKASRRLRLGLPLLWMW